MHTLSQKINIHSDVQIVLSVSQRQQLLALFLFTQYRAVYPCPVGANFACFPHDHSERPGRSRTTGCNRQGMSLIRKPHFGILVSGAEHNCQQALAELLWGETPFSDDPVTEITHSDGLKFNLQGDARLLSLVGTINHYLSSLHMRRAISLVAKAEEQLGGRFTDDAVLHLALIFAILTNRIQSENHLDVEDKRLTSLQSTKMWPIASYVAGRLGARRTPFGSPPDVAGIAMEMMAAPRNDAFPGELERESDFSALERTPDGPYQPVVWDFKIKDDRTLQNGLLNNIVPACFRQRFNLWFPVALNNASLPEKYEKEHVVPEKFRGWCMNLQV